MNAILSLILAAQAAGGLPVPPRSGLLPPHSQPPATRTVTTSYACDGGDRTFSIAYERHSFLRWTAGERRGVRLSQASMDRATAALRRLGGALTIIPECHESEDVLMVIGPLRERPQMLFLHWRGDELIVAPDEQPAG